MEEKVHNSQDSLVKVLICACTHYPTAVLILFHTDRTRVWSVSLGTCPWSGWSQLRVQNLDSSVNRSFFMIHYEILVFLCPPQVFVLICPPEK